MLKDNKNAKIVLGSVTMFDLIVIGAGPAGVSAAVYAASRGAKVLVLEKNKIGGLIGSVSTVTHYAGIETPETGVSLATKFTRLLESYPITIVYEEVIGVSLIGEIKSVTTPKATYQASKLIVAAGTFPRRLWVGGEERLTGKGVRMNALSDGSNYAGKIVMVVGGADGAVKEALYLASIAKKVYLVVSEDELVCINEFKTKILCLANVEIFYHTKVDGFVGQEVLEKVKLRDIYTKEVREVDCNAQFSYIGSAPNTALFTELVTKDGYLVTDENMLTSISGVYACGDIRCKGVRQVATAVSDGAIAAINALK